MTQTIARILIGSGELADALGGVAVRERQTGRQVVPLLVGRDHEKHPLAMGGDGASKDLANGRSILNLAHGTFPIWSPLEASSPALASRPQQPLKLGGR